MSLKKILPWVSVGAASFVAGLSVRTHAAGDELSIFAPLAAVLSVIDANYVDAPDMAEILHGAARGAAGALDPHTTYFSPEEFERFEADTAGRFAGIGVEVGMNDGWLVVLGVMPGSPAQQGGVLPGDRILEIDGRQARDIRFEEAVTWMRGRPGSSVRLALRRHSRSQAVTVELQRAFVEVEPVEARWLGDGILLARVRIFQSNSAAELDRVLDEAEAERELRGVVLDLRDNPGGLLQQAVLMADRFLASGTIVSTRGRDGQELHVSTARRIGTRASLPLTVLVNERTASAAEIVAAALHDHGRARLFGVRTFGKGSVQQVYDLPGGAALKLTVARYYTPSGRSIQGQGVEPDVLVEMLDSATQLEQRHRDEARFRESSLVRSLAGGSVPAAEVESDVQLRAALRFLRGT